MVRLGKCMCSEEEKEKCAEVCFFRAIGHDEHGNATISGENCVGCGDCMIACEKNNLAEIKEAVPMFELINEGKRPVYAMIAPAYISQFSSDVTPGKLRTAFKQLGFAGMIEVALFADILTLKEALEFDKSIQTDKDYLLTSCCCPMWIAMIKKVYNTLVPHLPPSVSPMAACGKAIKALYEDAVTVFIGPCLAKKAEAREKDLLGAVDFVLTFEEIRDILEAADIHPATLDGRRSGSFLQGGQALRRHLRRERGREKHARQAEAGPRAFPSRPSMRTASVPARQCFRTFWTATCSANFIEGMGCVGGCVGGPKALIDKDEATRNVNAYGGEAAYATPAENPFVLELLKRLGFDTIESLLEDNTLFTRNFDL